MRGSILFLACLLTAFPCQAGTITVDDDGPADFNNIQAAINTANNGDIVIVSPGTYTGPDNRDIDFLGKAITVRSADPNDPNIVAATIIDCNGTIFEYYMGFHFHNWESPDSILAGLTVVRAFAGGIHIKGFSSPTIINCIITGNIGGVYCSDSASPVLTNCTFSGNWAALGGGMFNADDASPTLNSCTFRGNTALSGGGMFNAGWFYEPTTKATLNNCTFIGNSADNHGGAIATYTRNLSLTNCTFSQNSAGRGGGVSIYESVVNLANCIFSENSASECGGALDNDEADANLINCTFVSNSAIAGSTLACDSFLQQYPSNLQVTNCILWGDPNEIWNNDGSTITVTYCDVQGNWPGEGNIDADPCFAFETDYHLISNSPCIDTGTNRPVAGLLQRDFDGNPRPLDGDGDGNTAADMGAYEFNLQAPSIALSPREFQFTGIEGDPNPPPQTLYLRNCGGGTLNWTLQGPPWLEAEPRTGSCSGEVIELAVWPNTDGLSPGHYYGTLRVNDPQAVNNPQRIEVGLWVRGRLLVPQEYPTIQAAIDNALDGDIVVVGPGTYTGDGNRDIDFLGKAITVRSTDPNDPNIVGATIIDCNGSESEPHRGFRFHNNEGANSVIAGFTITGGYIADSHGGAILCDTASPTITNCTIVSNGAIDGGGIACAHESNPNIINCIVSGNSAYGAEDIPGKGGGIVCSLMSSPTISNCTISGNKADSGGGIVCYHCPNARITNCTIVGNSAHYTAGGINCVFSSQTISNCTFSGNKANSGGAIRCLGSNPTIENCILWGDTAASGSEVALRGYPTWPPAEPWTLTVLSSDIQGGQDAAHLDYDCAFIWGMGNIDADPCFASAGYWADANDPNILVEPNDPNAVWVDGDYHLLPGSPCIDAGDNNSVPADTTDLDGDGNTTEPIPWDLDGNPRVVDGDNDGNSVVDMGAYEANYVQVQMKFTPQAFNPGSQGNWVKAHFVLPEGFSVEDVDTDSPAKIIEPFEPDIESDHINVFVNDDGLVEVEAAFPRGCFCGVSIDGNSVEVTALGSLTSGQQFYGTDTIRIIDHHFECLADFASYWLQTDCGKPDWCGDFDLNQDSVVNLLDFALFDACCIEIITE